MNTKTRKKLEKNLFKKNVLFCFLKIFFLFFFSMLPIAIHSILPLFIESFNYSNVVGGINGTIVAQAINYSQPILFFSINIITLLVVQVSFLIKSVKKQENFYQNKKTIINTGMYITTFSSFAISIIFVAVMMLYSEFSISDLGDKSHLLKSYSKLYISVMTIYILFSGISSYFIFMILEYKIKLSYMIVIELFFSILDVLLSIIFLLNFNDLSPVIRISLGTLISTIVKFIVVGAIFKIKVLTWSIKEIKFNNFFAKRIFQMSWMLSSFMLVYAFNIIIQMSFMNLLSQTSNSYIYYSDGESLIILSRIIIFSILNILVIIPKSLGRAVNLSSTKLENKDFNLSITQFRKSIKYNYYITGFFLLISLIVYSFLSNIVDLFFLNQQWTKTPIPLEEQSTIPFLHASDITYFDVIKKFILNGFIISVFAQMFINFTINLRIFIYFNFEKNISLFVYTILIFFISYSFGSYFLGVYFQKIFYGMIGFSFAQVIYGVMSMFLTSFYYFKITNKLLNINLQKLNEEKLKSIWKHKNIFKYWINRKNKIEVCLKASNQNKSITI